MKIFSENICISSEVAAAALAEKGSRQFAGVKRERERGKGQHRSLMLIFSSRFLGGEGRRINILVGNLSRFSPF
jgi:hypothetical protein